MYKKNKFEKIVDFIKNNKKSVFTFTAFILGILIFVIFVYARLQMIKIDASDQLAAASGHIAAGNIEQGVSIIDGVISKYSRTSSSYRARLMKANYLITQKNYTQAEQLLKEVIREAKPESVRPLAYPALIAVYDEQNNIDQAIAFSNEFLAKYKTNFLSASVMENLARLYDLSGNKSQAQTLYKEIADNYPDTLYASKAKQKLQ